MLYHKKKLGEKLGLPTFNHYYNIPITSLEYNLKNLGPSDTYIITFKQENNLCWSSNSFLALSWADRLT